MSKTWAAGRGQGEGRAGRPASRDSEPRWGQELELLQTAPWGLGRGIWAEIKRHEGRAGLQGQRSRGDGAAGAHFRLQFTQRGPRGAREAASPAPRTEDGGWASPRGVTKSESPAASPT